MILRVAQMSSCASALHLFRLKKGSGYIASLAGEALGCHFWPKADMLKDAIDVAIGGKRTYAVLHCICPLMTQSGHRRPNLIGFENWRRP